MNQYRFRVSFQTFPNDFQMEPCVLVGYSVFWISTRLMNTFCDKTNNNSRKNIRKHMFRRLVFHKFHFPNYVLDILTIIPMKY